MSLKLKSLLVTCTLVFSHVASADISGVGYASTKSEAKKEALSDLSQVIKSEVRSSFESTSMNSGGYAKATLKVSSDLPILGAEFDVIKKSTEVEAEVTLTSSKVIALYLSKLSNINDEIDSSLSEIKKSKSNSLKLKAYSNIFSLLKEYDRYESVLVILGGKVLNRPQVTKAKVKTELDKLNSDIDSVEFATTVLAKSFLHVENVFVYPPLLQNSTTVSEFGSVFMKNLKSKVKSSKDIYDASYILVGEYTLTKKMMVLNYELLDSHTNEVVTSKTININKSAYKNLKTKPKNVDFDALLNAGITSSSNLHVALNSNRGSQNLLFNDGEEIELFIKLNKQGYYYIVGYTQTKNGTMSYLLELQEGMGESRFIQFVNADDTNRWMSLGAFTIEPPYGVESIQVIASNQKITTLPSVRYDEESGYYIVSKDIKKALVKTRGLKKKKSKKVEFSEDVMSFTTMKR
ncbi:DUF4384 domain-containing protein [Sulfurimonas sp.]|nr:DUF4384 domain-containing protein [Sulfurimonas sp.]